MPMRRQKTRQADSGGTGDASHPPDELYGVRPARLGGAAGEATPRAGASSQLEESATSSDDFDFSTPGKRGGWRGVQAMPSPPDWSPAEPGRPALLVTDIQRWAAGDL